VYIGELRREECDSCQFRPKKRAYVTNITFPERTRPLFVFEECDRQHKIWFSVMDITLQLDICLLVSRANVAKLPGCWPSLLERM
jgi:hypothetical protein